MKVTYKEENH